MSRSKSTESDTKKAVQGCLVWVGIVVGLFVLVLGGLYICFFGPLVVRQQRVRSKSHSEQCATNLALYFQTYEPFLVLSPFQMGHIGRLSLPQCVAFSQGYHGHVYAESGSGVRGIRISYGGGMIDFGYLVTTTGIVTNGYTHWVAGWIDDNNHFEKFKEFDLPATARFPSSALMPGAAAEYLAPTSKSMANPDDWMRGVRFLLMTGHPEAGKLIDRTIVMYPNAEEPRLAKSLLMAAEGQGTAAITILEEWARGSSNTNAMGSFVAFKQSLEDPNQAASVDRSADESRNSAADYLRLIEAIREANRR